MKANRFVAKKDETVTALARQPVQKAEGIESTIDWSPDYLPEPVALKAGVWYEAGIDEEGFAYVRVLNE